MRMRPFAVLVPILLLAYLLSGCSEKKAQGPKTYKVRGKVVLPDGSGFPGGSIEFRSLTNPDQRAMGTIQEDGTFTKLNTSTGGSTLLDGAQEGEYQVTILPRIDMQAPIPVTTLPQPFPVRPDDDNDLTIQIPSK